MKNNLGTLDRILRFIFGNLCMAYTMLSDAPYSWIGMVIGVIPLLTAVFGTCPVYTLLGIDTRAKARLATRKAG